MPNTQYYFTSKNVYILSSPTQVWVLGTDQTFTLTGLGVTGLSEVSIANARVGGTNPSWGMWFIDRSVLLSSSVTGNGTSRTATAFYILAVAGSTANSMFVEMQVTLQDSTASNSWYNTIAYRAVLAAYLPGPSTSFSSDAAVLSAWTTAISNHEMPLATCDSCYGLGVTHLEMSVDLRSSSLSTSSTPSISSSPSPRAASAGSLPPSATVYSLHQVLGFAFGSIAGVVVLLVFYSRAKRISCCSCRRPSRTVRKRGSARAGAAADRVGSGAAAGDNFFNATASANIEPQTVNFEVANPYSMASRQPVPHHLNRTPAAAVPAHMAAAGAHAADGGAAQSAAASFYEVSTQRVQPDENDDAGGGVTAINNDGAGPGCHYTYVNGIQRRVPTTPPPGRSAARHDHHHHRAAAASADSGARAARATHENAASDGGQAAIITRSVDAAMLVHARTDNVRAADMSAGGWGMFQSRDPSTAAAAAGDHGHGGASGSGRATTAAGTSRGAQRGASRVQNASGTGGYDGDDGDAEDDADPIDEAGDASFRKDQTSSRVLQASSVFWNQQQAFAPSFSSSAPSATASMAAPTGPLASYAFAPPGIAAPQPAYGPGIGASAGPDSMSGMVQRSGAFALASAPPADSISQRSSSSARASTRGNLNGQRGGGGAAASGSGSGAGPGGSGRANANDASRDDCVDDFESDKECEEDPL